MSGRRGPRILLVALLCTLATLLALPLNAHNNATVHPEITDAALTLLRTEDMQNAGGMPGPVTPGDPCPDCAYDELWQHRGPLRPALPPSVANSEDEHAYITAFNGGTADIILGAVVEDGWGGATIALVLNHFYHARSGKGFAGTNRASRERAEEIFQYGIELHDYTDQSQERSYLYLGRFLHHVEDMSSPAHTHNDSHLTTSDDEKDDYEGRYVPHELWANGTLRPILDGATASVTVDRGRDIWPDPVAQGVQPPDGSLAGFVYNRSSYEGTLEFPTFSDPTNPPMGEFAQMFPDDPADVNNDGLHYDDGGMFGFAFWQIDGVGPYRYKNVFGNDDDTWWDEFASDAQISGDPDGVAAFYYIENLNTQTTFAGAIVPPRHRQDYLARWGAGNPVVDNRTCSGGATPGAFCFRDVDCGGGTCDGTPLLERQRDALLAPAVAYVAGAARWWYEIANRPPVLQNVEAQQGSPAVAKYDAGWDDVVEMESRELAEIGVIGNTFEDVEIVTERRLVFASDREHVNALDDLTLTLEFNEPIKEIYELKLLDSGGGLVWDLGAAVSGQGMPNDVALKEDDDKRWIYTIEAATLQGAGMALNGELTLEVRARDKNEHWQGIGGELDATPQSPARRNITGGFNLGTSYPWHTDATDDRFKYDYGQGDRTHRLLFDTEPPETQITVTP